MSTSSQAVRSNTSEFFPTLDNGILPFLARKDLTGDQKRDLIETANLAKSVFNRFQETVNQSEESCGAIAKDRMEDLREKSVTFLSTKDKSVSSLQEELNRFKCDLEDFNIASWSERGFCLYDQSKYAEAQKNHEEALRIEKKAPGDRQLKIAKHINAIGKCLFSQGEYAQAMTRYEEALQTIKTIGGDTLTVLCNIAVCLESQGKYQESQALHEEVLRIRKKTLDAKDLLVAISLNNLGTCLKSQGKYEEALTNYEESLRIRNQYQDENGQAVILVNIGSCLRAQGKNKLAKLKLEEALQIWKKNLGADHINIALTLDSLGTCFHEEGKYGDALQTYKEALRIKKIVLEEESHGVAISLSNIGGSLSYLGKNEEAKEHLWKAYQIAQKKLGENHPATVSFLEKYHSCSPSYFSGFCSVQ